MKKRLRKKLWRKSARILAYRASLGMGGLNDLISSCGTIPLDRPPTYEDFARGIESMYRVR